MAQTETEDTLDTPAQAHRWPLWLRFALSAAGFLVLVVIGFQFVYAGKIFPGVQADGVDLGGLSKSGARLALQKQLDDYVNNEMIPVQYGSTTLRIPVNKLGASYDIDKAIDLAYQFGRQGNIFTRLHAQLRAIFGRDSSFAAYQYDDEMLAPYLQQITDDVTSPVQNAKLSFDDAKAEVDSSQAGNRLDLGVLMGLIDQRLASSSFDTVKAPIYGLAPAVTTTTLQQAAGQADGYLSAPLTLSYGDNSKTVDQNTIASWLKVDPHTAGQFQDTGKVTDFYSLPDYVTITLDQDAVQRYVADIAKTTDQSPQNATLAMQDGKLTITTPSRNGAKLDQAAAVKSIVAALGKSGDREVTLDLQTTRADVNEDNLNQLGIKEQISEGVTYFPGSPSTRLTNVSAGAAKFNGVLLKPGEIFSFGALLGDVGPETGYVPELVILGDHEEKQYGGGLCQVSSTAFRAALLAGLPILERVNHAFAISYYTAPYGVPGVDATIYYPQVDFKFRNDTGSYILMQTIMQGTTLKFDFYGTKIKSGTIRGPEFVTGSSDAKQPSHTVFYRDVLDLTGNVIKTDKFDTYYKPSTDFPITKQFN